MRAGIEGVRKIQGTDVRGMKFPDGIVAQMFRMLTEEDCAEDGQPFRQ